MELRLNEEMRLAQVEAAKRRNRRRRNNPTKQHMFALQLRKAGFRTNLNKLNGEITFTDSDGFGLSGTATYNKDGYFEVHCPGYNSFIVENKSKEYIDISLNRNLTEPLMIAKLGLAQGLMMALSESVSFNINSSRYILENYVPGVNIIINDDSVSITDKETAIFISVSRYNYHELVKVYEWVNKNLELFFIK